eukprot:gene9606-17364_t
MTKGCLKSLSAVRLIYQVRVIKKNEYLRTVEPEEIRRKFKNRNNEEIQVDEQQDSNLSEQGNVETSERERPGQLEVENGSTQGETVLATSEIHILNQYESDLTEEQLEMIKSICELSKKKEKTTNVSFRNADRKKLREITSNMNNVLKYIVTDGVTETNDLINAISVYVSQRLGLKQRKDKVSQEPFWKRRIQWDTNKLRKTVCKLDRYARGQIKDVKKLEQIFKKHHVKKKGVKRGKMVTCDGIELPDGEKMKGVKVEDYKYLGIVELDGIKEK